MTFEKNEQNYTLKGEKEEWLTLRNLLAYARESGYLLSKSEARLSKELQGEIYNQIWGQK